MTNIQLQTDIDDAVRLVEELLHGYSSSSRYGSELSELIDDIDTSSYHGIIALSDGIDNILCDIPAGDTFHYRLSNIKELVDSCIEEW